MALSLISPHVEHQLGQGVIFLGTRSRARICKIAAQSCGYFRVYSLSVGKKESFSRKFKQSFFQGPLTHGEKFLCSFRVLLFTLAATFYSIIIGNLHRINTHEHGSANRVICELTRNMKATEVIYMSSRCLLLVAKWSCSLRYTFHYSPLSSV